MLPKTMRERIWQSFDTKDDPNKHRKLCEEAIWHVHEIHERSRQ